MADQEQQVYSFRGPPELAAQLDAHAECLAGDHQGVTIPRSNAILNLVYRGLVAFAEGPEA